MRSLTRSIAVGLTTFGASVAGMLIQRALPVDMLDGVERRRRRDGRARVAAARARSRPARWTAFGVFTNQQSEAYSLGPVVADIDLALEQYGPEGAAGRAGLRASLRRSRLRFFGDAEHGPKPFTFEEMKATFAGLDGYFDTLEPSTDRQRRLLAKAWDLARKYHDTQMRMARQLASPFPPHVLTVVIGWATVLFLGNGLAATPMRLRSSRSSQARSHRHCDLPDPRAQQPLHRLHLGVVRGRG